MNKLKDCVTSALPTLIANFEQENQKVLAMKLAVKMCCSNILCFFVVGFLQKVKMRKIKT